MPQEPKVEITLKEVYDTVMATHVVVTGFGPRLTAVEEAAKEAKQVAHDADVRSNENRTYLKWMGATATVLLTGGVIALISAWANKHI